MSAILYLDTSSLVKLYVEEEGSNEIEDLVVASPAVATSLIAYAEARSAFARRLREQAFSAAEYREILASFESDWGSYAHAAVTIEIVRLAGNLAEKHALRGFDGLHLSSAVTIGRQSASPVRFSSSDRNLGSGFFDLGGINRVAMLEGVMP